MDNKKYPYFIKWENGRTIRIRGRRRVINDIHQHIRVVNMLDKLGLEFDIISNVLDKYRERLTGLPKPLNFKMTLTPSESLNFSPSLWFRKKTISLEKWLSSGRGVLFVSEKEIKKREIEGQNIRIGRLFTMIENSKTDGTSTDIWTGPNFNDYQITIPPIPHGYKGVVMENIKFMGRLNHIKQRGTTNHWCSDIDSSPHCLNWKFIDYKKLDKTMKYWKLSPLQIKFMKLEKLENDLEKGLINEGEYLIRVNRL
jgi:hypothetical protein